MGQFASCRSVSDATGLHCNAAAPLASCRRQRASGQRWRRGCLASGLYGWQDSQGHKHQPLRFGRLIQELFNWAKLHQQRSHVGLFSAKKGIESRWKICSRASGWLMGGYSQSCPEPMGFVVVLPVADAQPCWGAGKLHCHSQPEPTGAGARTEAGSPALIPVPFCGVVLLPFVAWREPEKTDSRAGIAVTAVGFFPSQISTSQPHTWAPVLPQERLRKPMETRGGGRATLLVAAQT